MTTVAEIRIMLPSGSLTDAEIEDLIDIATANVGLDNFDYTLQLAVAKLKIAGKLPDSATVGQVKQETNISKTLGSLSEASGVRPKQLLYYGRG